MNFIDALRDPRMIGALPAFRDLSTWRNWMVFLKALDGLPLDAEEEGLFCQHTGRSRYSPPPGGFRESAAIVGRQSGKTRVGGVIQNVEAVRAGREHDGTELYALSIAQDQRSSLRTIFRYATSPFEFVGALKRVVTGRVAGAWTLGNGVVIASYPCRPAAVRGLRACVAVLDELAFYKNSENMPVDVEMLRAVRPCLATTGGRLVILSSPYGQTGALWELHRRHYGRDDSPVLIWQASAPDMNPTLPADYLSRMAEDDPEAYRSEVLGEFRSGVATFLDAEALGACVDFHVREHLPEVGLRYVAAFDASGGRTDRAALAIAHSTGDGSAVLDLLRTWNSPHNPAHVIAEASAVLGQYRASTVSGDEYSAEFVVAAFREHGITYQAAKRDRSAHYLELQPLLNAGRVRLLEHVELLCELRGLERRRGATRDRIDHRPGGHDDRAIAATMALIQAATAPVYESISDSVQMPSHAENRGPIAGLAKHSYGNETTLAEAFRGAYGPNWFR